MNFTKYDVSVILNNKYTRDMTEEKLDTLKTILRGFIDDIEFINRRKVMEEMEMEARGEKDSIKYQSICRISQFIMNYYDRILFDDFVNIFVPWGGRPWSLAENFTTFDKKFFVREMNGFWYCLPIVKYFSDFVIVKTPDEIAMEGDNVKAYNNRYTCMLGFIVDLAEYALKTKEEK